jgi:hypothetical protein
VQHEREQTTERERVITARAPQFEALARQHLSMAGCYREEQVADLAHHMAARSLVLEQPPRQGDVVRQLPPPRLPALPPPQQAQPIYQGMGRPASRALGSEPHVVPEAMRQGVHDAVATYVAQHR